jgi:hypothetical protein
MRGADRDPFPQLAALLRLRRDENPLIWFNRLSSAGPWRLLAREPKQGFWPQSMPAPAPGRIGFWRRRPLRAEPDEMLKQCIVDCHAWLTAKNARFIAHWLPPSLSTTPTWIGDISEHAFVWSLIALAARWQGPKSLLQRGTVLQKVALGASARAGDLLVLHRETERLARHWLRGRPSARLPANIRTGGLRTSKFLLAAVELPPSYRQALLLFLSFSPLSQMTYLDLCNVAPDPEALNALGEALLGGAQGSASEAQAWLTLLTNTVVGALVSKQPALDDWERRVDAAHKRSRPKRKWRSDGAPQGVESEARRALLARLKAWRAVAECNFSRELNLLVLDRLTRLAVVRAMPAMRKEWSAGLRDDPQTKAKLLLPGSACFSELTELLLGGTFSGTRQLLSASEQTRLSETLGILLGTLPTPTGSSGRFADARVRLPFPPPNHRGRCPGEIIQDLLAGFQNDLPRFNAEAAATS